MGAAKRAFRSFFSHLCSFRPNLRKSAKAGAATLLLGAAALAGCSSDNVENNALQGASADLRTPGVNAGQLAVMAAFRSVCLGTSLDQQGAERALSELGYKPEGRPRADGERRYVKDGARVLLSGGGLPGGGLPGGGALTAAGAFCAASYEGMGRREAGEILETAIRGTGMPYGPHNIAASGGEMRATVEGSDYIGAASVIRSFGDSGLSLSKSPKPPR